MTSACRSAVVAAPGDRFARVLGTCRGSGDARRDPGSVVVTSHQVEALWQRLHDECVGGDPGVVERVGMLDEQMVVAYARDFGQPVTSVVRVDALGRAQPGEPTDVDTAVGHPTLSGIIHQHSENLS